MTDCPECGGVMGYDGGVYKCRHCGFSIHEDEFQRISIFGDDEDDDMPKGCAACGGDYPNCIETCNLMSD